MSRTFQNLRVTVMGLGVFGGGEGVVRFLSQRGAHITLTDLKSEADLAPTLARLDDCRIDRLHLGQHHEDDFRGADLIVVNPAVPRTSSFLKVAQDAGVELTSEMNLFIELLQARPEIGVAAVTGSIGKSTTTALVERMAAAGGMTTWLGGNIGRSLLPEIESIRDGDLVVLELSSFQLSDLNQLRFRPDLAIVTNFRPNHLDWHTDLADYRWAKQSILRWQRPDDLVVLNADDRDVSRWPTCGRVAWFGQRPQQPLRLATSDSDDDFADDIIEPLVEPELPPGCFLDGATLLAPNFNIDLRTDFPLPGAHHALNAAAACAGAVSLGVGERAIRTALREFTGLPHRLQSLGTFHGRRFFDDSKATTPEAAIAALESFEEPVVLLAGGYDKHVDLEPFAEAIARRARAVVLMGQTAAELHSRLLAILDFAKTARLQRDRIALATDFPDACRRAIEFSCPGDAVLLAPGCASYGWFNNYVERGEAFASAVTRWAAGD